MKTILALFFLMSVFSITSAAHTITGTIGKYPIEMLIETTNWETGDFTGKYRYEHKESYLELEGQVLGTVIYIEEFYKQEITGHFYLELKENQLTGKWLSGTKWYPVTLNVSREALPQLKRKTIADFSREASTFTTGTYRTENYYINDWWFSEEKPVLEIGFSGGDLILEEVHKDSLKFKVSVVCGPTYHIAYASGIAHRTKEQTYECLIEAYENDSCFVYIELSDKGAHAWAIGNYLCGFGARAYLDHEFVKISDIPMFEKDE